MIRVDSRPFAAAVAFAVLSACASPSTREARIDPRIAGEIAKIKAIDNHAHPVRPTAQGEKPDDEYDALPVETLEAQSDPVRSRPGAPELQIGSHRQSRPSSTPNRPRREAGRRIRRPSRGNSRGPIGSRPEPPWRARASGSPSPALQGRQSQGCANLWPGLRRPRPRSTEIG